MSFARNSGGLLLALFAVGCTSAVDVDKSKFSCATTADCGEGYECRPQVGGGGFCFKLGACSETELCNGLDDNCNGLIDENFPAKGMACSDGGVGQCRTGVLACAKGKQVCTSTVSPTTELCNGLDDNCNGMTDEPFDLTSDNVNCGGCGRACGAGTTCKVSRCRESNCGDGIDNDHDGGADCYDPACLSLSCFSSGDAGYFCGVLLIPDAGFDAGTPDAGAPDSGVSDAGPADAGDPDAGDLDGGFPDDGGVDGGDLDAGLDGGFDGGFDAGFDGGLDAGVDAGPPPLCFPKEVCNDGVDNDFDGLTDCADPECNGKICVTGTACTNSVCPGPG